VTEVLNFNEVAGTFSADQLELIEKETEAILLKMNSTRTTPNRPQLKKDMCIMVRHLSEKSLN